MKNYLTLVFILFSISAFNQIITWKGPEDFAVSTFYQVKVNGMYVPVYDTPIASYAIFDFSGEANVEVSAMFDVRWVDIRPIRCALKPEYTGEFSFRFLMKNPENVSVELNGRIRQQPLFIFSGKPEALKPSKSDKDVIWFEGGKIYKDVKLELMDNQTVYIEGGAVVQGYIFAEGKKNIKITGRGILDGTYNRQNPEKRNWFIHLADCENISIEDIVLHNSTTWQTALFHCNNASIKGIRIVSENGGDDGIDIFRCTNVLIDGVFAHTKDDCVAIKSGGNYPADQPTNNILVKNCVFWNSIWGNALEIGFELYSDEVKNIKFENIDIIHVEDGAAMSIHNAGQSDVHDVIFKNIRIEDCRQKLIDVAIFFSQYSPDGIRDKDYIAKNYLHGAWDGVLKIPEGKEAYHSQFRGTIHDITFEDIQVVGGLLPFSVFHGYDAEKNITGISIENLSYMGVTLTNTENARIRQNNTKELIIKSGDN